MFSIDCDADDSTKVLKVVFSSPGHCDLLLADTESSVGSSYWAGWSVDDPFETMCSESNLTTTLSCVTVAAGVLVRRGLVTTRVDSEVWWSFGRRLALVVNFYAERLGNVKTNLR